MMAKEQQLSTLQRKQTALDLTSPAKRLLTELIENVVSKILDTSIANFFNENALPCRFAKLLISVLNSVINMLGANIKLQIDAKKVDSFLNQRMSILLPQHSESPADSA
jgi:hypothetical protein